MALLERVSTLIRANLNDLIDKAENPETMIKQVILDMENQLLQVKTQVAISMADQHMLEKKQKEQQDKAAEWMRKAELAVDKGQDDLARAAIERHQAFQRLADGFGQQVGDQRSQVEMLRSALGKLDQKLGEARAKSDLLLAQHRRSRALNGSPGMTRRRPRAWRTCPPRATSPSRSNCSSWSSTTRSGMEWTSTTSCVEPRVTGCRSSRPGAPSKTRGRGRLRPLS